MHHFCPLSLYLQSQSMDLPSIIHNATACQTGFLVKEGTREAAKKSPSVSMEQTVDEGSGNPRSLIMSENC